MQFTKEECDKRIEDLQKKIPSIQIELNQLLGYRQCLIDLETNKNIEENPKIED
jgi:hypothetical protein